MQIKESINELSVFPVLVAAKEKEDIMQQINTTRRQAIFLSKLLDLPVVDVEEELWSYAEYGLSAFRSDFYKQIPNGSELLEAVAQTKDVDEKNRIGVLKTLKYTGDIRLAAKLGGYASQTVNRIWRRFQQHGLEGLKTQRKKSVDTDAWEQFLNS